MGAVHTDFGAIGFTEAGTGGVPLVLLHGVGSDKRVWRPQLEQLASERRAVAFDLPGYGESDFQPGATRDDFACSILAGMTALGIERAHICGLSLGGVIAIAMHAAAEVRCASLIIVDSFAVHPEGGAVHARSLAACRELGMQGLAKSRVDALLAPGAPAAVRDEVVATMTTIDPAAYAVGAEAVWLADQRERAAAVRCPTLILCGSEDRVTPPALSEALKDLMPHAGLVEIAGAGHLSNLEQPAIFNRVVAAFLAGVE
jgi:3-oxoadipate enol-lactonase